jgi:hypothetical protein
MGYSNALLYYSAMQYYSVLMIYEIVLYRVMGESYRITISGDRVRDMFDKVALPYKKDETYNRRDCDSHWSFIMEETAAQQYYSFETDGNQMFLLADNTTVHA